MRVFYIIIFIISIAFLLPVIYQAFKNKKSVALSLRNLLIAAAFACIINLIVIISQRESVCYFAYSLFFVGIDWIIYFLMHFVIDYTKYTIRYSGGARLVRYILLFDSASMIMNPFFFHVFSCKKVITDDGELYYRINSYFPYTVHLTLCYVLLAVTFGILIYKTANCSVLYKGKYISVLVVLSVIILLDAVYVFFDGVIDISILGFAFGGLILYYLTVIYIPRGALDRMLSIVVHDMKDSIMIFDTVGNCLHVNENARQWLIAEGKVPSDHLFESWYQRKGQFYPENTVQNITANIGDEVHYLKICRKHMLDKHNIYIGCFFHIQDVTEDHEKHLKENYLATHDSLTGIYNKEYFYERAEEVLLSNPDTEYLMVCSDIHNFKLVNDVFGTEAGDRILIRIAKTLRKFCNENDVFARIGNDRFGLLMPKKNFHEDFFNTVPKRTVYVENDIHYPIKVYVGVYEISNRDIPVSVMFDRSLMALMTIKGNYQTSLAYYDDALRDNILHEQEIMGQFEDAIASGQFQLYLQAQVDHDECVHGAEALVRWFHPENGIMPPSEFINIFEKNGTIVKLDRYMWECACQKLKEWQDAGHDDIYLSVNISPKDFYYIDVYDTLTKLVKKYDVNPKNLHLEITETAMMTDVLNRIPLISSLRKAGFTVEMDDFGSGYSSLNTLKDIYIDVIKVDMAFLQQTKDIDRSKKILTSIIHLAKELGIRSIVEGVETPEQVDFLKQLNCDMFQGYYFAKPVPVSEFEATYM